LADGTGTDPVNYSKDNHKVVLDDHDRSKNNPSALTGYELELQPDAGWPGLSASGQLAFDPPAIHAVVQTLGQLRTAVSQVPSSLVGPTDALSFGHGSWHEANVLQSAQQVVSETVRIYSDNLIANLDLAMQHISGSATQLATAEDEAHAGTQTPAANLGDGPQ